MIELFIIAAAACAFMDAVREPFFQMVRSLGLM